MATFTTIADTVLEPGKPIRSVDTLALRDNPIAIAGGAAGAPRIVTNAINNSAVTTAKLATNERMTTANVLSATAGASAGAVGTYAWLSQPADTGTTIIAGSTYAGSGLRFFGYNGAALRNNVLTSSGYGATPAGTWRAMGTESTTFNNFRRHTLFLRIS